MFAEIIDAGDVILGLTLQELHRLWLDAGALTGFVSVPAIQNLAAIQDYRDALPVLFDVNG